MGGPVGGIGGSFSVRGDSGTGRRAPMPLEDDLGFIIDADGTMHFSDAPTRQSGGVASNGSAKHGPDFGGNDQEMVRYAWKHLVTQY